MELKSKNSISCIRLRASCILYLILVHAFVSYALIIFWHFTGRLSVSNYHGFQGQGDKLRASIPFPPREGITNLNRFGYRPRPRMVGWDPDSKHYSHHHDRNHTISLPLYVPYHTKFKAHWAKDDHEGQMHLRNSDENYPVKKTFFRDPYLHHKECVPMHEWQTKSFPTCNNLHEISMTNIITHVGEKNFREDLYLLGQGYFRHVFAIRGNDGIEMHVLKTLRYDSQKFNEKNVNRHRKDATVTALLTSSPFVIDIYGYCANSGVYEYGSNGSLEDRFKKSSYDAQPSDIEMLRAAVQVAQAISDVHAIGGDFSAVVHADIKYNQFININGIYKLNDFNRCHFMYWNSTSNDGTCPYVHQGSNPWVFRSPEEYSYDLQTEKIDVYSMGNIFYVLLFGDYPFSELKKEKGDEKVKWRIQNGKRAHVFRRIKDDGNEIHKVLAKAIKMCWVQDWRERSSSKEVVTYLSSMLKEIEEKTMQDDESP